MNETTPHYLVITIGTAGDIHPFIRVAKSLQTLGRKVTLITNAYHAKLVQGEGVTSIGLGTHDDYQRVIANPDLWNPKQGFSVLMAAYGEQWRQMDEVIRSMPRHPHQVAITHPFAVPGAVLTRERGLVNSVVAAYLAPSNLRSCHDPMNIGAMSVPRWVPMRSRRAIWKFVEKRWVNPVALAHINAIRKPLGLPRVRSFLAHIAEAPDLLVTLFPPWFAPNAADWPRPLISGDFQLFEASAQGGFTEELSAFLEAGEKPLVFTPGTGNIHAADFFDCALSAVNRLGRRAIFLTKEPSQIPAHLPESVLWQPYAPLSALLPHAATLIHHGGIGTTAEALRAGTPQLVAPFAWDQFDNGARIASLGVGKVIPAKKLQPRNLARSLRVLNTSEAVRAQCSLLASHFTPVHDPIALCRKIESVLQAERNSAPTHRTIS
ncbi:MAG: hypothetical protein B7Y40_00345 [Gammaproteobacteria bacterium 28-57-27]|nr:MAG: hypothetical protein B7Y40_00345 [Gammaproteobacteria bacterium 28-57-27]